MLDLLINNLTAQKVEQAFIAPRKGQSRLYRIIISIHFYKHAELLITGQRTKVYHQNMNAPEMAKHYFRHAIETFHHFSHKTTSKRSIFDFILSKLKNHPRLFNYL